MGKTSNIKKLEGVINGLVRELAKLAPHPDHPISSIAIAKIGNTQVITPSFNMNGALMMAYMQDLPARKGIERRIAAARRRLASLQNTAIADAFALAA
jgi:hypothetical protein